MSTPYLNQIWNATKYEEEIAPKANEIYESEGSNRIEDKIYAY